MTTYSTQQRRGAVVLSIMGVIAAAHVFPLGRFLHGDLYRLYRGYSSDLLLPFGFYFLLLFAQRHRAILRHWAVRATAVFVIAAAAETCQYFGIPVLGATFDPIDYLVYAIGVFLGILVDTQLFPRVFSFWSDDSSTGRAL